jgi:hypothetical protein
MAFLVAAALVGGLTITHDQPKPFDNPYGYGRPWNLSQTAALATNSEGYAAIALAAYDRLLPPRACIGAAVAPNEPTFLLYGPRFQHRVIFLPVLDVVASAIRNNLFYVVVSAHVDAPNAAAFQAAGWKIEGLSDRWALAVAPHAGDGACSAA